jgi:hypothetical protein
MLTSGWLVSRGYPIGRERALATADELAGRRVAEGTRDA